MIVCTEESYRIFATLLYEASVCASITECLKELDSWDGATVREGSVVEGYRSTNRPDVRSARIMTSPNGSQLLKEFDQKIDDVIIPLVEQIYGVKLIEHSGTQIVRYGPGEHYAAHQDVGCDLDSRYFSIVCYLNDDFEGGHTSFPALSYSVIPQSGKVIIFPSQYLHCAEPVTEGEKYVLVSWINGPRPIKWI